MERKKKEPLAREQKTQTKMSKFNEAKGNPKALVDYLGWCEDEFKEGLEKLKIHGELQKQAAEQPAWLGRYDEIRAELKALRNWYDGKAKRRRGTLYREFLEQYSRALQHRDIEQYINSDKRWQSADDVYQEVALIHDKFDSLVEAFRAKGWAISHIVKLRVAGLEDAIV